MIRESMISAPSVSSAASFDKSVLKRGNVLLAALVPTRQVGQDARVVVPGAPLSGSQHRWRACARIGR